ncbi:MAG: hypothetical protein RL083_315 [Pseudomonadota bacterium]
MNHPFQDGSTPPVLTAKRLKDHVWTPGADVQSVWKKYGWTPPSKTGLATPSRDRAHERPAVNNPLRVLRG